MLSTAGTSASSGRAGGLHLGRIPREGSVQTMEKAQPPVAVVTGGSRGIGRGIVGELAAHGFSIIVNYRADALAATDTCRHAEQLGSPRAVAVPADVADLAQG